MKSRVSPNQASFMKSIIYEKDVLVQLILGTNPASIWNL